MIEAEEIAIIRDAARLAGALPEIKSVLSKMQEFSERRVYKALSDGTLTPEQALIAWQERMLIDRLDKRLSQKVVSGQTIAHTHASELE